ncbi:hypothetical protein HPB50_017272 [Hyalomma asiaticum]|uniref:Uncharacterized protein n=1 Tax=Hyalomma asiaticum TaxID=266040 RepID=A0ACB7SXH8_HYAAI|nr:hypothetical protein HPB50_017272 [Hyalomma asiaticum]
MCAAVQGLSENAFAITLVFILKCIRLIFLIGASKQVDYFGIRRWGKDGKELPSRSPTTLLFTASYRSSQSSQSSSASSACDRENPACAK